MEYNYLRNSFLNKYFIITILLIVFGFLLYVIQYEDIGSKLPWSSFKFQFNFGLTKHIFNVKEYHYKNYVLEVIGNYEDASSSKENVLLKLKNISFYRDIANIKNKYESTQLPNLKNTKTFTKAKTTKSQLTSFTSSTLTSTSTSVLMSNPTKSNHMSDQNQRKNKEFPDSNLFRKYRINRSINCAKLIAGDDEEQDKAKHKMEKPKPHLQPEMFINSTKNCDLFKLKKGYITNSLTMEEENFPIAFSLLVFKDIEQVERLLRAIYRPQNVYCIHFDTKSKQSFKEAVEKISSCFENVFVTSSSVDVNWGTFSVLEPELICLKALWQYKKWKYFINLTGQEFPLRTNLELVKILKIYNGSNDMEGTVKRANTGRWAKAGKPPHEITPVKGSVHITANRDFIDYVLHNQTAKDFLEWVKKVDVPDETFFTSLNHNPQLRIPGSYKGEPETDKKIKPFLTRFKNWGLYPFDWDCHGKRVRLICVFGIGDLPLLSKRPEFFANKFYDDYEPLALDCMEELHYNRTRDEYFKKMSFNTTFYENLEFIKNKI